MTLSLFMSCLQNICSGTPPFPNIYYSSSYAMGVYGVMERVVGSDSGNQAKNIALRVVGILFFVFVCLALCFCCCRGCCRRCCDSRPAPENPEPAPSPRMAVVVTEVNVISAWFLQLMRRPAVTEEPADQPAAESTIEIGPAASAPQAGIKTRSMTASEIYERHHECPVCYEEPSPGVQIMEFACGHVMRRGCYEQLKACSKGQEVPCPQCRQPLAPDTMITVIPE